MNLERRISGSDEVDPPEAAGDSDTPPPLVQTSRRKKQLLMAVVPLILLVVAFIWWQMGRGSVSTDNAQVLAHVVDVAPEVSGKIGEVFVSENQQVRAGQLLYTIDRAPFRIALLEAQAAVGTARLQVAELEGDYGSRLATIDSRSSDVQLAEENFERQRELLARGFTTRARYDEARAALAAARAQQQVASADASATRALLGPGSNARHPRIAAAEAMAAKAQLDLARTEVRAPISGVVAQTDRLSPGSMATQMLSNLSIVGGAPPWLEANFKETQLARIHPGQRAEVTIDAIPGRKFAAHVASIGAGTGSEFSLLPAQNASGNWVKVTQRVAVRLAFDQKPDIPVVSGWSAHVKVFVDD